MDSSKKKPPKPKPKPAKNKAPAPVQITAEKILRQARDLHDTAQTRPPKHQINDAAELAEYQSRKRKEFEDQIQRTSGKNLSAWAKYAE
ncbi:hypothetical protein M0R45_016710 [Rubus argutus]|uniref:Uncharacterized protein n=1 Tax=Rubus argutus TaxID=59490 RepID=A0AAW1XW15_RUBAR